MSRLSERIENFEKAFALFSKSCSCYKNDNINDINKLALTQSFEIIYELGWKVLKDILSENQVKVYTPKDCIKEAFSMNIIPNGQIWIDMAEDRNASSHEYNMDKVNIILEKISTYYYQELTRFNEQLKGF